MKVIISHDIDHLTVWEHKKDLVVPKFVARCGLEWASGSISMGEYFLRVKDLFKNKWQNLTELMDFNNQNGIPATFFIAVSNGVGLAYRLEDAAAWINQIATNGFDVGVHGIAFDNGELIQDEYDRFQSISKIKTFGIRNHYLRNNSNTLEYLEKVGYLFDSTLYMERECFKVGNLWEFPLHIMDGNFLLKSNKLQFKSIHEVIDNTKYQIERINSKDINYLNILFHDRYFNKSFKSWRDWYIWLITYLKDNNMEFISYKEAINEMEK